MENSPDLQGASLPFPEQKLPAVQKLQTQFLMVIPCPLAVVVQSVRFPGGQVQGYSPGQVVAKLREVYINSTKIHSSKFPSQCFICGMIIDF